MSFKFNRSFDQVARSLAIPHSDHELFLERVDFIKNKILQKMDELNSVFNGMIQNLEETAYYEKGPYIDLPIEFNTFLKLKMPFIIEPYFRSPPHRAVQLRTKVNHPIVNDGIINSYLLNWHLGSELMRAARIMGRITCNDGAVFKLCYDVETEADGHTITASEVTELGSDVRIIFSFMPAIMIIKDQTTPLPRWICRSKNIRYWFALPFAWYSERYYYAINHKWQNCKRSEKIKAKKLILLLQKIFRRNGRFYSAILIVNIRTYILTLLDQEDMGSILNNPLGDLFMDVVVLFGNFIQYEVLEPRLLGSLILAISNTQMFALRRKLLEFQSGQERFKVDDIKALFGI